MWKQYKFSLERYDRDGLFTEEGFRKGVTDTQVNDFLQKIYNVFPIPKRKFAISDEIDAHHDVFNFDIDQFNDKDYEKHEHISFDVGENEGDYVSTPPLQKAYDRIQNDVGRVSSYQKLFGGDIISKRIADLGTAIHSTSISEGLGLENFIYDAYPGYKKHGVPFEEVLKIIKKYPERDVLFNKVIIPGVLFTENGLSWSRGDKNMHLDFLYFKKNFLYIRELKDTGELDTKKISIEISELELVSQLLEISTDIDNNFSLVQWSVTDYKNLLSKIGSDKRADILKEGKSFADLLGISYDKINTLRFLHNSGNTECFIEKAKEIISLYEYNKKNEAVM